MDRETADFLRNSNLDGYIEIFAAERIDLTTLILLGKEEIKCLFPQIGDRLRFEAALSLYKDRHKGNTSTCNASPVEISGVHLDSSFIHWCEDTNNEQDLLLLGSLQENSTIVRDTVAREAAEPEPKATDTPVAAVSKPNSVRTILEATVEGQQILQIGLKTGQLPLSVRGRLCKHLLEQLMPADNPVILLDTQLRALSEDIGKLFVKESPLLYYAPYLPANACQAKRNVSGWLVNARGTRRAHLISLGLLEKPKSRSRSLPKSNVASLPPAGIEIKELKEGDAEIVASALEQLTSASPGPWQEVSALWRETVKARLRYLYFEKGTLQKYFDKYPILKSPDGWRLLVADYEALYPAKILGLQSLEASREKIFEAARQKRCLTKDKYLRQKITDTLAYCDDSNPRSKTIAAILLIGCLFNIPPSRRSKKDWQASRAEIIDGFITTAETESDIQVIIEERRQKLQKLDLKLQPFIIWCRESGAAFTVCDNVLYKFASLPDAVDVTFKIYHATAAQYPTESYNIWIIIQIAFYDVKTTYDRLSQSVKETLVTLGATIN